MVTVSAPSRLAAVATSIAVLPAPITRTSAPTSHSVNGRVWVWKMKSSASQTPSQVLALDPQRQRPAQADAQEDGVERLEQSRGPRRPSTRWSSRMSMPIWRIVLDLGEGELGRDLVGGDAERVEAAGHVARLEDDHVVSEPSQLVGAAQPGRARADHGHPLARRRARPRRTRRPCAAAASQANRWSRPIWTGAFISSVIDARPFAEDLGRAGAGATAAEDVGVEDRPGRADLVAMQDLADEPGDVDVRRAGPGARGVEAEQAARGLDPGLVDRQRRRDVGEPRAQIFERLPLTGPEHGSTPDSMISRERSAQS